MKRVHQKLIFLLTFLSIGIGLQAQSITVKGFVYSDDDKAGLIGVNILIKETASGTATDFDGTFELNINQVNLPATLQFSYTGYTDQEIIITKTETDLQIKMETDGLVLDVVEVKGQRIDEKKKASALTVESLDGIAIKQTASSNFYDGLGALKGVDLTSASLGIKVVNTRGFNSTAPVRILQVIDGVDNASPSVNFALGNFLGSSELDLRGVELVVGASSAFYGPNAFNGVIKMTSQDPFYTEGLSFSAKGAEQNIREGEFRWADSKKNKEGFKTMAYKFNLSYLNANDWVANNFASVDSAEVAAREGHYAGYDAVNRYGDEYNNLYDFRGANSPWNLPGLTAFYREGYREQDLVDYSTKNLKVGASISLRTQPELEGESPQLTIAGNFAEGSTIFQGPTRFRLEGVRYYTARLEYAKRNKFFLRAYMTKDALGKTYNPFVTALKLNQLQGDPEDWANQYRSIWTSKFGPQAQALGYPKLIFENGQPSFDNAAVDAFYQNPIAQDSLASWHLQTLALLNQVDLIGIKPRLQPGTPEYEVAVSQINSTLSNNEDIELGGSRLFTNSELYHLSGEYIFNPTFVDKLVIGGSGRYYTPDTKGTIFDDLRDKFTAYEFGFYAGIDKKIANEKLTLSVTGRVDKNQRYDWIGTPAASLVWKPTERDYIRMSFSSAIRNPTNIDQFLNLDVGPAQFVGNVNGRDSLIEIESLEAFAEDLDRSKLVYFDVPAIQPEKVKTFELGYRTILWDKLYVDGSYYYNIYDQFIGFLFGLDVVFSDINIPITIDPLRVTANSQSTVTTQGAAIGLNYYFANYFQLSGNYTWSKLNTAVDDDIIPAFNTPEHKYNFSLSGRDVPIRLGDFYAPNFGFNVNYKYVDGFIFEGSPQFTGFVPSYALLDAQVNYHFKNIHTTLKIGASNILDNQHFETVGGPLVGRIGYVKLTYQLDKK